MPTALESRAVLRRLTETAVESGLDLVTRLNGSAESQRATMLETIPPLIDYFASGSAALAADSYEDEREAAAVRSTFTAEAVVVDRTVKVRRAIAWSAAPLVLDPEDIVAVTARLAEVIQYEVARPFRDTITANRRADTEAVGWRRITRGGCGFCRMLADRGAVYRESTARFAAHPTCHCTAQPVFKTNVGEEASAMQYLASRRNRTATQRAELREFLDTYYPD